MNAKDELVALADRLQGLEFEVLKKKMSWERIVITRETPQNKIPESKPSFAMRVSTGPNGQRKYELRSATVGYTLLPADRKLWPIDAWYRLAPTARRQASKLRWLSR